MNFKSIYLILMLIIPSFLLSGCANTGEIYNRSSNARVSYEIDKKNHVIVINNNIKYYYKVHNNNVVFTYPDNKTATVSGDKEHCFVSSQDLVDSSYMLPEDLFKIYLKSNTDISFINFIPVIAGLLIILFPKLFWYMEYGWALNSDAGPFVFKIIRIGGILIVIAGVLYLCNLFYSNYMFGLLPSASGSFYSS